MLQYKMGYKGVYGFCEVWLLPLCMGTPAIYLLWGLISGSMYYADSTGKTALEVMFVIELFMAACFAIAQMSQWLVITDDEIRQKSISPLDYTIWWCPWNDVVSVQVWSDKMPSDPHAVIKRIIIRRPFATGKYPRYELKISSNISEIRQLMDYINAKIPSKVVWEVQ